MLSLCWSPCKFYYNKKPFIVNEPCWQGKHRGNIEEDSTHLFVTFQPIFIQTKFISLLFLTPTKEEKYSLSIGGSLESP